MSGNRNHVHAPTAGAGRGLSQPELHLSTRALREAQGDPTPRVLRQHQHQHNNPILTSSERDTSVSGMSLSDRTVPISRELLSTVLLVSRKPFCNSLRNICVRREVVIVHGGAVAWVNTRPSSGVRACVRALL